MLARCRGRAGKNSEYYTPLLTYRDPLRSREGPLSADEQAIRNTSLKEFFFQHLSTISRLGQFIVIENVDRAAGFEPLHLEIRSAEPHRANGELAPARV